MTKQSLIGGSKGLALLGAAIAVVIGAVLLVFSVRLAPVDAPQEQVATVPATQDTPVAEAEAEAEEGELAEIEVEAGPQDAVDAPTAAADTPATEAQPAMEDATPDSATQAVDLSQEGTSAASNDNATPTVMEAAEAGTTETAAATDAAIATATDTGTDTATVPDTASAAATTPAATAEASTTAPAMPSFDTVRLAPDGEALVAGRGLPGRTVQILLDGAVVGTAMTAGDGAFVAFLSLPPSDAPRVLTLVTDRDGEVLASDQQVIIAPVQVARAETEAPTQSATVDQGAAATPAEDRPAAAPALLLADDSGVRVLQPATPADPARVSGVALDVISYTSDGDVLLQGRATADQTVLVYLDNAAVTSAPVGMDGIWSTGLPGVAPGIYTLRLDEVDAAGKVLSRIETPFKREDRDEVAAIAAATAPVETTATTAVASGEEVATATAAPASTADDVSVPSVRVVTVQPGNTLWAIARESYGAGPLFVRVFEANRDRIRDPDLIYPGQIFEIPD